MDNKRASNQKNATVSAQTSQDVIDANNVDKRTKQSSDCADTMTHVRYNSQTIDVTSIAGNLTNYALQNKIGNLALTFPVS